MSKGSSNQVDNGAFAGLSLDEPGKFELHQHGTEGEERKLVCCQCNASTRHTVVASAALWQVDPEFMSSTNDFEVVRCGGCGWLAFLTYHTIPCRSGHEPRNWNGRIDEIRYPAPVNSRFSHLQNSGFPPRVRAVLRETILAHSSNMPLLAALGIRTLVEEVCRDQKASGANLFAKIDQLKAAQQISRTTCQALHGVRILGNRSAHRCKPPGTDQLDAAFTSAGHLLADVYVIRKARRRLPKK